MRSLTYLGWVRDSRGRVQHRPPRTISNAITSMCGGGHYAEYGMGNTTPYIVHEYR